jgi:hypothetical protein
MDAGVAAPHTVIPAHRSVIHAPHTVIHARPPVIPAKAGTQYAAAFPPDLGTCMPHDLILTRTPVFTGFPLSRE